ncbi:MAG: hemerythrin family protein [Treponemataceae bacterium]|nr:MAG: hemerythrin family protein [Treponemataceae bacterium]
MADEIIEWEYRFSLGIPIIDKQHQQLVALTNKLYSACLLDSASMRQQFKQTMHEAVDYVRYHFSTEEKLMALLEFTGTDEHKKQHENFVREVLQTVKDFEGGKQFVPNTLVRYLREWIFSHIAVYDKRLAEYVQNAKKTGKVDEMLKNFTAVQK